MSKKEKTKIGIKGVIFSLAFALIVFIALLFIEYNIASDFEKEKVVVAINSIEKGQQIKAEEVNKYFKVVEIDKKAIADKVISDISLIKDIVVTTDISCNEQLTPAKYLDIENYITLNYKEPTEISYKVENLSYSAAGTLRRGNIVDIYGYDKELGQVVLIKESILILGAYDGNGVSIDGNKEGATVVFNLLLETKEIPSIINSLQKCTNIMLAKAEDIG